MTQKVANANLFIECISKYGDKIAYKYLYEGDVVELTYKELVDRAKRIASFFIKNGFKDKHIAILGSTSVDWVETYFGILLSSNVAVPLDKMLPTNDICNLLRLGEVDMAFLSEEYANHIPTYKQEAPDVKEFISFSSDEFKALFSTEICEIKEQDENALAELIFTSGTTGVSKGVMLSQKNIITNALEAYKEFISDKPNLVTLSVLPIHHTFELTVNHLALMSGGSCVCINDKLENIIQNMQVFKPNTMMIVPMMAELFYRKIEEGTKDPATKRKFNFGLKLCKFLKLFGGNPERKIFKQIHEKFGGNVDLMIVGGAALRDEVVNGMERIGIELRQGYGLTENSPIVSVNSKLRGSRLGSVGQVMSNTKVRIEDGEIQISGPSVTLGYYKNEEATKELITEDGWLKTGDLGHVDKDGFLFITGRKKNLIILDNGKNIYPEELEEHIYLIEGVKDAMVYDFKGKICAMIQPMQGANKRAIEEGIKAMNAELPTYKKVSGVNFRLKDFPKTTTMKIKRRDVMKELEMAELEKKEYVAPTTDLEKQICSTFEQVLSTSPIGLTDDFFENGGDSLGALEVATILGIQAQEIYDYTTPEALAKNIISNSQTTDERVAGINDMIAKSTTVKANSPKNVLLTGATGFLGSHILAELVKRDVNVTCLVRDKKKLESVLSYYFPKDYTSFKYSVVSGNIESDHLGIAADEYAALTKSIDTVVHVAANVHHTGHYEDFERTNVNGTENVIKFCEESGAVMHHTSTASVSGAGTVKQQNPDIVFTEKILDIGQSYEQNVYIHSKYKAEEKVLLARERGLKASIYRIGNLTWRNSDGVFQKNADDNGFVSRCKGLIKVGAYTTDLDQFPIDFTPVDMCADAYVRLVMNGDMNEIYHMINPNMSTITDLKSKLNVKAVSKEEFEKIIMSKMPDKDVAVLSFYCKIASVSQNIDINADFTVSKLNDLGFKWPSVSVFYLRHMLKI